VGQPILAAVGFQPTMAECEDSRLARKNRLKGGCGQIARPTTIASGQDGRFQHPARLERAVYLSSLRPRMRVLWALGLLCLPILGQDNYEIQVYGSESLGKNRVMIESHTNFTFDGTKSVVDGVRPTEHSLHETIEITTGFTNWFETGFYIFTANTPGYGYNWVGNHIRPRFSVPSEWKWPVGVSLSTEFGYQRRAYSADSWTWEIRPIVDKKLGRWYLCFNPSVDKSIHGLSAGTGWAFSPNVKVGYDITKKVQAGFEYYGSLGPVGQFDPLRDQQQQIFPSIDLDLGENWEFNAGIGIGITQATDHLIAKVIIGRRFSFGRK
jgi:hypothetical protein